jgi:hypothetical protein
MMHRLRGRHGSMQDGNLDVENTIVRSDPTSVACCYLTIAGVISSKPKGGSPEFRRNWLQGLLKLFRVKALTSGCKNL